MWSFTFLLKAGTRRRVVGFSSGKEQAMRRGRWAGRDEANRTAIAARRLQPSRSTGPPSGPRSIRLHSRFPPSRWLVATAVSGAARLQAE